MRVVSITPLALSAPPRRIPFLLGNVPAGWPSPADDYVEASLDLSELVVKNPAATFFVRAAGDSMRPAIEGGDVLVVDRSLTPAPGRVVIACLDGELTVKRLRRVRGRLELAPENPAYRPIPVDEDMDCVVWGVVTFVVRQLAQGAGS